MELGTLPEWFTACAEVLAVCTALFLPQYTAYRNRKASYDRMLRVTSGLLRDLADDLERCCGCDALQLESAKDCRRGRRMRSTTSRVTRAATKPRSPHVSTTSCFAGG